MKVSNAKKQSFGEGSQSFARVVLWLTLAATFFAIAGLALEDSPKFKLRFQRLPPVEGQSVAFTNRFFGQTTSKTGAGNWKTNNFEHYEITGNSRVIEWDETNQISKVELKIENLLYGNLKETKTLIKGGDPILAKSLLGEVFFSSQSDYIQADARTILKNTTMLMYPFGNWVADDEAIGTDRPRSQGETWVADLVKIRGDDRVLQMIQNVGISASDAVFQVHFAGITNYLEWNCFHLLLTVRIKTDSVPMPLKQAFARMKMEGFQCEGSLGFDLIVPFDDNLPVLLYTISANMLATAETQIDGTNTTIRISRSTMNVTERRPLSGFKR